MNPEKLPKIGGLAMDPLADMALPMLLNLSTAVTVGLIGSVIKGLPGVALLPLISVAAFLFAWESYLYTTVFTVRDADAPVALRYVEFAVMAALAYWLGALPASAGVVDAAVAGWSRWQTWVNVALLGLSWFQGYRGALQTQYLHPGLLVASTDQERVARNDHANAFENVTRQVLLNVAAVGIALGTVAWMRGDVRLWGWSWLGAGLLLLAGLAAGTILVAAQLKQRITWAQERLEAAPQVTQRWFAYGLGLLLVPALLALLLPAGPRLPVERLLALLPESGMSQRIELPKVEQPAPEGPDFYEMLKNMEGGGQQWQWQIPAWFWYAAGAIPALWLLYLAARQMADRRDQLRGAWAVLAVIASWYLALWRAVGELLGGVLKQAVRTPVEALSSVFGEAGAVGRYLPFRGGRAPAEPRAALRFYFARLQVEAGRKGVRRGASGTAAEFARRLAEAAPAEAAEIDQLKDAYEHARYSPLPVDAGQASFARRAWVAIARAIGRK